MMRDNDRLQKLVARGSGSMFTGGHRHRSSEASSSKGYSLSPGMRNKRSSRRTTINETAEKQPSRQVHVEDYFSEDKDPTPRQFIPSKETSTQRLDWGSLEKSLSEQVQHSVVFLG